MIPGDLEPDDFNLSKQSIKSLIARSTYHSLKIASSQNRILWNDDFNIIKFFNTQDNIINVKNRIFSQGVFKRKGLFRFTRAFTQIFLPK